MNAVTDITAAETAPALDPSIERAEARLRDLEEVRAICMSVARLAQTQVLAQVQAPAGDKAGGVDFSRQIDRAVRAVRLTIILEEKVEKIIRDLKAGRVAAAVEGVARRRRDAVERVMMTAIRDKHGLSRDRIEQDREQLDDYLGREAFDQRPVSESVRRLCDMLGLRPDWKRWADEPWANEEVEAGVPGSPYRVAGANPTVAKPRSSPTDAAPPADSS